MNLRSSGEAGPLHCGRSVAEVHVRFVCHASYAACSVVPQLEDPRYHLPQWFHCFPFPARPRCTIGEIVRRLILEAAGLKPARLRLFLRS